MNNPEELLKELSLLKPVLMNQIDELTQLSVDADDYLLDEITEIEDSVEQLLSQMRSYLEKAASDE